MKKIPYGIDDFDLIIQDDYYYIDKSMYIPTLERRAPFILFVRPRRMGKSLFVNMLMSYYDIDKGNMFDKLFGKLWIGENKTQYANSFLVLKFDFSQVNGIGDQLVRNFNRYCFNQIRIFFKKYSKYFSKEDIKLTLSNDNVGLAINYFVGIAKLKGYPVYLFLDEYDNFSNTILAARGVKAHEEITHGDGFYRDFFKSCKGSFQRIFMTGIAPVTYDDLTSGFNIADHVTLKPRFDTMVGVTEDELRDMLMYYQSQAHFSQSTVEIIAEMKKWYDNFCFSEKCYNVEPSLFNTNSVMRYISSLIEDHCEPDPLIDYSARIDYSKLNFLVMAEDLDNRDKRIEIIREICAKGSITGSVNEQFPAARCGNEDNFKSMLFYFGTLTYGGYEENGKARLIVPNKNMGELYLKYLVDIVKSEGLKLKGGWESLTDCIDQAATNHDWQSLISKIGEIYNQNTSLRNSIKGEVDVQAFIRGLLCLNEYYDIWPELELGKGYCDVLLVPKFKSNKTKYSYLIEIKYMKAEEKDVKGRIKEACDQLNRYVSEKYLTNSSLLSGTPLTLLYTVFRGQSLIASGSYDRNSKEIKPS